jgi:recombination protein RecT
MSVVNSSEKLKQADQTSIYMAAMMAASLDLPINSNLGFAYIIPFEQKYKDGNGNWSKKTIAQFQIGYRGFIQLAQRSGVFHTISATPIYKGQLVSENPLIGFEFDFKVKPNGTPIGYASYFKLLNGFEKTLYMSSEELMSHGKRFSQTFKSDFGLWKDDFDAMCLKTVIKLLLSKFAPLSIEMQKAVISDQSHIKDADTVDVEYVDNKEQTTEEIAKQKEQERLNEYIKKATSLDQLKQVENLVTGEQMDLFNSKKTELSK